MVDRTPTGMRCETLHMMRTVKGDLPRGSQGKVLNEIENLGRHLIVVQWDAGMTIPVFPDEVRVPVEEQVHTPVHCPLC
jgi:hypothetical protein